MPSRALALAFPALAFPALAFLGIALLVAALFPAAGAALARPVAGELMVLKDGERTKVRLGLSQPLTAPIEVLALQEPRRLAIDLKGVTTDRRTAPGAGQVAAARLAQFDRDTARLVLDLDGPAALRASRMVAAPGATFLELLVGPVGESEFAAQKRAGRLQILPERNDPSDGPLAEVERALQSARTTAAQPAAAQPAAAQPDAAGAAAATGPDTPAAARGGRPTPAMVPPEQVRRARSRPVVVLDPGHGGRDVGTVGVNGQYEKDVTLAIARAAGRILERSGKVEVRLTRTDDRFLTLAERVRLARSWNAALFISIHADSAPNQQARGASVYTLSETASDREAARLAAKENRADAIAGRDLSSEEGDAQVVLIDLALRDSMNASADFAQMLQRRLEPEGVLFRSTFHRFAGFQVLRNLGVPAVLLETGYLSNAEDAAILASPEGQRRIARGMANAVEAWLIRP